MRRAGAGLPPWSHIPRALKSPASLSDDYGVSQPTQSVIPFLHALASTGGSDLHCKVGSAPRVRVDGRLRKLQVPDLKPADTERMLEEVIPDDLVDHFRANHEADFAYSIPGVGRFRVNAYQARGTYGMVFRRVAVGAQSLGDLALPEVVGQLALEPRGLVLVTGPTGSGKTTTLASMVDLINTYKEVNIVTIEDPIEILHQDKKAIVLQREVRQDTADFTVALRAAMRQDPDVILVGEMRDVETVRRPCPPPRPVTSSCPRCTRSTRPRRSTASSTSSRRTSRSRSASRWPSPCAVSSRSDWSGSRTAPLGAR